MTKEAFFPVGHFFALLVDDGDGDAIDWLLGGAGFQRLVAPKGADGVGAGFGLRPGVDNGGGSAGVEQEQRVFGGHGAVAVGGGLGVDDVVPPKVAAVLHGGVLAGALHDQHGFHL